MISLNGLSDQIKMIVAEHKHCGVHCHSYGQPNTSMEFEKENEHLAAILTYYGRGVING